MAEGELTHSLEVVFDVYFTWYLLYRDIRNVLTNEYKASKDFLKIVLCVFVCKSIFTV